MCLIFFLFIEHLFLQIRVLKIHLPILLWTGLPKLFVRLLIDLQQWHRNETCAMWTSNYFLCASFIFYIEHHFLLNVLPKFNCAWEEYDGIVKRWEWYHSLNDIYRYFLGTPLYRLVLEKSCIWHLKKNMYLHCCNRYYVLLCMGLLFSCSIPDPNP